MIFSRRLVTQDELDGESVDYMGLSVATAMPRRERKSLSAFDRRTIQLRAIGILKRSGFPVREIAVAVGLTERHVRNRIGELEELADKLRVAPDDE